ncbi:unnamed protein product [Chondrus crispus]|uniref:Reverse transcriptase RNase H-like domain-containing protein n=1 Tax=Chondrus crispus TaxID=2769 RepID=R7QQA4_CHOCR|nr:unnamed protein product [Chondrus crispus]CDF39938.1 unnamed protein product [Chondrus crispus]|eukprot:XP_005710232.1 unnamed protein product [Chondrus crispus]
MPFGLKGAPATFQRALDIILSRVRWQICLVYLDDLSVADTAADAFKTFTFPRTLTQMRSFLGACNVYRRFVKGFAKIARPLTDMTRKGADPDFYNPTEAQLNAFDNLKRCMIAPPILALPRYGRPYMIDTDASAYQLGCTLLQEHDQPNDWRPVGYWSYSLKDSERNYSATERECFAVVWAVRTQRPYVEGTKFTVRTDHEALRWLMSLTESSGRLNRWRLRLAEYDFTIQYRPGRVHQVPDALSRLVSPRVADDPRPTVEVDDDIPTFDGGTTVRDVSNELADRVCTASCDHQAVHVFVTTRNQAGSRTRSRVQTRDEPRGDDEAPALQGPTSFWEKNDEFDAADIERAEDPEADAPDTPVAPPQDDLSAPLTIEEIAEE